MSEDKTEVEGQWADRAALMHVAHEKNTPIMGSHSIKPERTAAADDLDDHDYLEAFWAEVTTLYLHNPTKDKKSIVYELLKRMDPPRVSAPKTSSSINVNLHIGPIREYFRKRIWFVRFVRHLRQETNSQAVLDIDEYFSRVYQL